MPRKKICEHPTRHLNSPGPPKVQRSVPSRLNQFMRDRYDLDDTNVTGLCAKCFAFENREMKENDTMNIEEQANCNDGSCDENQEDDNGNEIGEQQNDSDRSSNEQRDDVDDEGSGDDSFYELTYQQQRAMETLSKVFQMLNIDPIHDRQVDILILTVDKYPLFKGPTWLLYVGKSIKYSHVFINYAMFSKEKSIVPHKQILTNCALKNQTNYLQV